LGEKKLIFLISPYLFTGIVLIFDYRKPTFSGRFLNFNLNHPISQKKGTIFSLVDRSFLAASILSLGFFRGLFVLVKQDEGIFDIFAEVDDLFVGKGADDGHIGESVDLSIGESVDLSIGESVDLSIGESVDLSIGEGIDSDVKCTMMQMTKS
ncbi:hypothetical protein ALC56_14994, partial [Trachymyrmex septentrionalis]